MSAVAELISRWVRPVPDWPEPGVTFRDITPLIADAGALAAVVDALVDQAAARGPVDAVIGVEARGFIFAPAVALRLGVGFVPVRKLGKLPAERLGVAYDLEYGSATVEMHADALRPGARVIVTTCLPPVGPWPQSASSSRWPVRPWRPTSSCWSFPPSVAASGSGPSAASPFTPTEHDSESS